MSLQRLTAAFAQMLGDAPADDADAHDPSTDLSAGFSGAVDPDAVCPKRIVEAILFVGADGGRPRTAEELAAAMRDVTTEDVREAVAQLNAEYERDASAMVVTDRAEGYKLQLREELGRVRDKFYGRVKEVRLSPKALEVLSVVAYRQPTTAAAIDKARGVPSSTLLAQLVRRGLVRCDCGGDGQPSRYSTTGRFLRFFGLDSVEQLPRAAELDD
ncbi:Segregation and condensation protein B [Posidoniimonas polymericola]|uniref:Segregation and condensation protein B n=1 Tax=Posidoniimonas polymericola TaxID=2528002 RepID=A0A5C5YIC8_9BACT|nr:SMC-Scp complex subunit ScpB [Posidoniimonas polymericola]TWT74625.1 Segregation and condensation protein B [Posidoniimonas polymericola]